MTSLTFTSSVVLVLLFIMCASHCFFLPPEIRESASAGKCPSQETVEDVTGSIRAAVSNIIQNTVPSLPQCGMGRWYRVVDFEVTSGTCPPPWELQNIDGNDVCGKSTPSSCDSVSFSAGGLSYSTVCGRITGRASNTPDGYQSNSMFEMDFQDIDEPYIDGISLTHSTPRAHIWTFAADHRMLVRCPCSTSGRAELDFVGTNYFCDHTSEGRTLWDGEGCVEDTSQTCCEFNSPPHFSSNLTSPTTADIEVRICTNQVLTDENIFIESMELYVQ